MKKLSDSLIAVRFCKGYKEKGLEILLESEKPGVGLKDEIFVIERELKKKLDKAKISYQWVPVKTPDVSKIYKAFKTKYK